MSDTFQHCQPARPIHHDQHLTRFEQRGGSALTKTTTVFMQEPLRRHDNAYERAFLLATTFVPLCNKLQLLVVVLFRQTLPNELSSVNFGKPSYIYVRIRQRIRELIKVDPKCQYPSLSFIHHCQ